MQYTPLKVQKGWIYNTVTKREMKFQFNPPQLLTEKESHWEDTDANNTHPHQDWKGGGNHKINFSLTFIYKGGYDTSKAVVWLRTLTEPISVNKKYQDPPICLIRIGGGTWKVKVRKVSVEYHSWLPGGRPNRMVVILETVEYKAVPKPIEQKPASSGQRKELETGEDRPYAYLLDQ